MENTKVNKGGGGKGNQTLEELELELEDELVDVIRHEYEATEAAFKKTPALLNYLPDFDTFREKVHARPYLLGNYRAEFADDSHPLSPTYVLPLYGLDIEACRKIVRLSVMRALRNSGYVLRKDATKVIEDALSVTKGHASKLFNRPWEMQKDHVQALAKVTECTIEELRGDEHRETQIRKAKHLLYGIMDDIENWLDDENLARALGAIEGIAMVIRQLRSS